MSSQLGDLADELAVRVAVVAMDMGLVVSIDAEALGSDTTYGSSFQGD